LSTSTLLFLFQSRLTTLEQQDQPCYHQASQGTIQAFIFTRTTFSISYTSQRP
jgi:hypothetical protein